MIRVLPYNATLKEEWDCFIANSRNSTLLHLRDYMDYHSNRFEDASLIFYDEKGHLQCVFPACISNYNKSVIVSHQGLTYGGFVISKDLHAYKLEEIISITLQYYKKCKQATQLIIKPIPYIYDNSPCQEELYFINQKGGKLTSRSLSQTIEFNRRAKVSQLRSRCINKAKKNGIYIKEATSKEEWADFHNILTNILFERHSTLPVHTLDELWSLHEHFPTKIKLYIANKDNKAIAGCVLYFSENVIHTQYLASSVIGIKNGALDLVIDYAINACKTLQQQFFDFGVSTERNGLLNYGLTLQKEGFGARGVCYDTYTINL